MEIALDILFWVAMIEIAYVDFKKFYIYEIDLIVAAIIAILKILFYGSLINSILGSIAGLIIGYSIYKVSFIIYGDEVFGFGDVLLLGVIGMYFEFSLFFHYFALTIMAVGFIAGIVILFKKEYAKKLVPLAPILVFGGIVYVLCDFPTIYILRYLF